MAQPKKHPTEINGWESFFPELATAVHQMRYDRVEEFHRHSATELMRQASGDRAKDRVQLASLLEAAARAEIDQSVRFAQIWELCKPHMPKD